MAGLQPGASPRCGYKAAQQWESTQGSKRNPSSVNGQKGAQKGVWAKMSLPRDYPVTVWWLFWRRCAGNMPSIERYFATVRRAM